MESIWSKTSDRVKRPLLDSDIHADVADRIGGGQTKNTTAKITSQHGMFCHTFVEKKGEETAEKYVQANQSAVEEYKRIVREEKIDCDLTEADAYVYSMDGEKLRQETEAA